MSAAWFAAMLAFFLVFESDLRLWSVAVLTFGTLGWMGFFLGPWVWRWISGSSSNVAVRIAARMFGVAMVLVWLLLLYGSLLFWMPYMRETFVP